MQPKQIKALLEKEIAYIAETVPNISTDPTIDAGDHFAIHMERQVLKALQPLAAADPQNIRNAFEELGRDKVVGLLFAVAGKNELRAIRPLAFAAMMFGKPGLGAAEAERQYDTKIVLAAQTNLHILAMGNF